MDAAVSFEDISDEVLERVLDYLDSAGSMAKAAAVCRRWAAVCRRERLWYSLYLRQPWVISEECVPFDDIDPVHAPRPHGHDHMESWRDVCRDELPSVRFDCVHEPDPMTRACKCCGRQVAVPRPDSIFKVLLLGSNSVGKTMFFLQLKTRFAADVSIDYRHAPPTDFCVKSFAMDGTDARVSLWDLHLPSGTQNLLRAYHRGAPGYAIMFDVSNRDSFEAVKTVWFPQVVQNWTQSSVEPGAINTLALVGVRQDLTTDRPRTVTVSEACTLAFSMETRINESSVGTAEHQRVRYIESNPVTGLGVDRVMATLVRPKLQHCRVVTESHNAFSSDVLLEEAYVSHKGETRCTVM